MRPEDLLKQRRSAQAQAPTAPSVITAGNRSTPEQLAEAPPHAKYVVGDHISWKQETLPSHDPLPDKVGEVIEARSYTQGDVEIILYKVREPNNVQYWFAEAELTKVNP